MNGKRQRLLTSILAVLLAGGGLAQETLDPADTGQRDEVAVHLMLLDILALDRNDRTVPDLTLEEFEILVDGKPRPIDTLDVYCDVGVTSEPRGVRHPKKRDPVSSGGLPRRIALVYDFLHLPIATPGGMPMAETFDRTKEMIRHTLVEGDEVMVVALTGGLRIEQTFTADHEQVFRTLKRMERDISLWGANYDHITEDGFFDGLTFLVDLLGTWEGPKAAVLFSAISRGGAPFDLQFDQVANAAAAARVTFYPVDVNGLGFSIPFG